MPEALLAIPAVLVAAVFVFSGVAKLRTGDTLENWREMGIPKPLRRRWLLALHPWGELLLAAPLVVAGSWIGAAAAAVATALMLVYLVIIVRLRRSSPDPMCSCFGDRERVTTLTVARNAWYLVLTLAAFTASWQMPLVGGPARVFASGGWAVLAAAAAAAVTVWFTTRSSQGVTAQRTEQPQDTETQGQQYRPTRIPALTLLTADGESVNLRHVARQRAQLLLAVRPGCTPCEAALELLPQWRERLPEVTVRKLLMIAPEHTDYTEFGEAHSLHDPDDLLRQTLGEWRTPTLLLLGADGNIVGEPVTGLDDVVTFVDEIEQSLQEARHNPA